MQGGCFKLNSNTDWAVNLLAGATIKKLGWIELTGFTVKSMKVLLVTAGCDPVLKAGTCI